MDCFGEQHAETLLQLIASLVQEREGQGEGEGEQIEWKLHFDVPLRFQTANSPLQF